MTDFFIHKKTQTEHWYQEPWMLLVLGGPAIVVVAAILTFYIAWQGEDNVLTKDYYRQGINIDNDINRDAKADEYKMLANVKVDNSGKAQLHLEGNTNLPTTILMVVSSYAQGSEFEALQKIYFTKVKANEYDGSIKIPSPANAENLKLWHVKVIGPDWRLTADWHDPLHSELLLKPQN